MKKIVKTLMVCVLALTLVLNGGNYTQAASMKKYKNTRFKYSVKYPKYFKLVTKSQNNDGATYQYKGISFSVYGSTPFKKMTGKKFKKLYKSYGMKMKKVKVTKYGLYYEENHTVDVSINYVCYSKKYKTQAGFYISCPKNKLKKYRKIAKKIKKTLKFGK